MKQLRITKQIILVLFILFTSCDIKKRAVKNKEQRTLNEVTERKIQRRGDTVTYEVPNIKFKDTTIYTVNRQGTTLRTVYDNSGQISQIDCFASMIEEITKSNRQLVEAIKNKDTEKEEKFDSTVVLYIVLGVVVIIIVTMFLIVNKLSAHTNTVSKLLEKL